MSETRITLNGKSHPLPRVMTLEELVQDLHLESRSVAVGRNGEVVPRPLFPETQVQEGDEIDIVHFVSGG